MCFVLENAVFKDKLYFRSQDLVAALLHPGAAAAGALQCNDRCSENTLFFKMHTGRIESELSTDLHSLKKAVKDRLVALVELPGFEPGQTEPKSVVLPLHHSSVPIEMQRYNIFVYLQYFSS